MQNIIARSIYNTVGVLSVAQNKFRELVEELIQNGHFTEDEGKRIIDQFLVELRAKVDHTTGGLHAKADEFIRRWSIVDLNQAKKDMDAFLNDLKNNPLLPVKLNKRN